MLHACRRDQHLEEHRGAGNQVQAAGGAGTRPSYPLVDTGVRASVSATFR